MKIKVLLVLVAVMLLSGCAGLKDSEGWKSSQKSEFLDILENDDYASICNNNRDIYNKVKSSKDSKLMTKLLVSYTKNLANGCSNIRNSKYYEVYRQGVNEANIILKLKGGESIKSILTPYKPKYRQFSALVNKYQKLKKGTALSRKIRKNIERIKLMKPNIGNNYALVNIPEFKVRVIENDKTALAMKVIVGKRKNKTPVFSAKLRYITLNPQWSVPDSIARKEIIPKLMRNKGYAKARNMVIIKDTYDLRGKRVNPSKVDWSKYKGGEGYVPYKFVQVPSRRNGLGRVKFIFPNNHSVYMHDTLSKGLFNRKVRTFSHGCVRLQRPVAMLDHLTTKYTGTGKSSMKKWYNGLKTKHINLNRKLMVHTAYLTTYVNKAGTLLTFSDVYGYDRNQRFYF